MGLDLRLLPFDFDDQRMSFSHTMLSCERGGALFDAIMSVEKLRGRKVPSDFSTFTCRDDTYEETHYGNTQETPYGEPLKEVEVEDLLALKSLVTLPKNRAIWAYLAELSPRTKVALFWH